MALGLVAATAGSVAGAISLDGAILAVVNGDGFNLQELRPVDFFRQLRSLAERVVDSASEAAAGTIDLPRSAITCAIAGQYSDSEIGLINARLTETALADCRQRHFIHRGHAAFLASFDEGADSQAVLKCGTDAFAFSLDSQLGPRLAGGWGLYSGNDGGGFSLGLAGLEVLFREFDGRLPLSQFSASFCGALGATDRLDLVRWLNQTREKSQLKMAVSQLAIPIVRSAEDGDPVAAALLDEAADEMVSCLSAVLHPDTRSASVCVQGMLVQNSPRVFDLLRKRIESRVPLASVRRGKFRPILGALRNSLSALRADASFGRLLREAPFHPKRDALLLQYHPLIEQGTLVCQPQH